MKSKVFARPNLNFFVLGAAVILCVQHLINSGLSQSPSAPEMRAGERDDLRSLMEQAYFRPNPLVYTRLSTYFEKRGDYKKALYYLRKADALARAEESFE
jgi:hypothetical protein